MTPGRSVGLRDTAGQVPAACLLAWSAARITMSVYCVLSVVAAVGAVAAAVLARSLFDGLAAASPVVPPALALTAVGLLAAVLPALRAYLRSRMLRQIAARSLDRLYAAIARLSGLGRLEDPAFGDQMRLALQSGRSGPGHLVDDALGAGAAALTLAGFAGLLTTIHLGLSMVVLAAAAPTVAAQRWIDRICVTAPARRDAYYGDLLTSLAAAKEVRLLRLGDLFRSRMLAEAAYADRHGSRQDAHELRAYAAFGALSAVLASAGLLWAVGLATQGVLTVGDLVAVLAAIGAVQVAALALARRIGSAERGVPSFRHYRALEAASSDLPEPAEPAALAGLAEGIELVDVWFRYAPDKPWVLRGVTFTIPCGQTVALVGLNGTGKSTLIKLLCRFYDPTLGSIRWDGRDIRRMRVDELRARIGAVFQDFMQYDLSAAENVGVGDIATLGDLVPVHRAARLAGVHDTLQALPDAYDTPLSDAHLSGGQWQRVALARAYLRDDLDLMILDEPASGLDAHAEYELHQRLRERRAGRTSLLVSHRLGAVRTADLIVVLADGKVAERGRHADLLASDGRYARLFHLQATGYTPDVARGPA